MSQVASATKWRTSASIILVTRDAVKSEEYKLLMLKRSDATAVMVNQTVFPGGLLDTEADENVAWLQYLEEFGVPQEALRRLVLIRDDRPAILAPQGTGCYDRFFKRSRIWAREITLRLTAVRECFEEVGLLLCRSRSQLDFGAVSCVQDVPDLEAWQRRVHDKPSEFLTLCRELKVVPDLWALHEWSAWASPTFMRKGYETVFFMAFVDKQPKLLEEPSEVKETLWLTPVELLRLVDLGEVWFLPPQVYELSRLMGIKEYQGLLDFAIKRSALGTTMFLPVSYDCKGSMVFVLPGDDFYVPEPNLISEIISFPGSEDEFRSRSKHLHRYTYGPSIRSLELNIPPPNGHLRPLKFHQERQKL
ncbi:LOW QUALITY PROTEIN: nucleoside diphosphate-linked moiety X motif 19 [Drosophila eugracilis]|uniref:LOW QUALITY PROTEIN: nucleoside diphosphate-linked moiety X motif 19 n=1 Tax=Drosophila eugracilis TaxID=29029 RepID=UPI001BDB4466|nr:LOW QUALITY PROTEIN: nucleoside diphosphate-linked moiety X motif 19 [Drosophila eugracilis]